MKDLKILMIDDHPMIIEGYQNTILSSANNDYNITIDIAHDCDSALYKINKSQRTDPYNIFFVDIRIPPTSDGSITSGEDLSKHIRKVLPDAKIIILTMHNESYRIHNIIKTINPEGLLIKSDLTSSELSEAFYKVLDNPPYYSSTVNGFLRKTITSDIVLDDKNRKILHLLSKGVKTKNLSDHLGLSLSAVEKRKKQLKMLFSVEDGEDETLLREARSKGFL